jgi:hypothetical protein
VLCRPMRQRVQPIQEVWSSNSSFYYIRIDKYDRREYIRFSGYEALVWTRRAWFKKNTVRRRAR